MKKKINGKKYIWLDLRLFLMPPRLVHLYYCKEAVSDVFKNEKNQTHTKYVVYVCSVMFRFVVLLCDLAIYESLVKHST